MSLNALETADEPLYHRATITNSIVISRREPFCYFSCARWNERHKMLSLIFLLHFIGISSSLSQTGPLNCEWFFVPPLSEIKYALTLIVSYATTRTRIAPHQKRMIRAEIVVHAYSAENRIGQLAQSDRHSALITYN